ncbi:DgyrCDS13388 [Dimorphilus gyrociliatus]|uniref:DgyrCDS13388 n=1 Tax=Dimorphilus gyrociliatus TaxID=2664684 RepID=A0A7I8WAI8_9ANNE|nr:DgyrCDS13388 [Dimorphilus gyrociliatus]
MGTTVNETKDTNTEMKSKPDDIFVMEDNEVNSTEIDATQIKKKSKGKRYVPQRHLEPSRRQKAGVRKMRRNENTNFLLNGGSNGELDSDIDVMDNLIEPGTSPLDCLMLDKDKMQVTINVLNSYERDLLSSFRRHLAWNDFINCSEEDQQQFLEENFEKSSDDADWEFVESEADQREVHPAYTSEECFNRIDKRLKNFLRRRHVPLGRLDYLERYIIDYFKICPISVLVMQLDNGFERMLCHALCQYHLLHCYSMDDDRGCRNTHVENKREKFIGAPSSLYEFIVSA